MKLKKEALLWILLPLLAAVASCTPERPAADPAQTSIYSQIDDAIERSDLFRQQKEKRLEFLRDRLSTERDPHFKIGLINEMIKEFESYNSDSAQYYINENLILTSGLPADDPERLSLLIKKADVSSHAGLFNEAVDIMESIPVNVLDSALLENYYSTYCGIYQYQVEYSDDSEFSQNYQKKLEAYTDSLLKIAAPESLLRLIVLSPRLVNTGHGEKAIELLQNRLADYRMGMREFSILHSLLAYAYKIEGDENLYRRHLSTAALSDIEGVIKENMAIRELASVLFEEGDVDRANRYLKQSFADATFFAARMRYAQSSQMLPVIDKAYNDRQQLLQKILQRQIRIISVFVVIFILALMLILKQYLSLKKSSRKEREANAELSQLSAQLKSANTRLEAINVDLREANHTKEEYAALFMEYCSSTISTLQQYHQSLRVLATQSGKAALMKKLESTEMISTALQDFYSRFDEAILNIYPSFVDKFNALLQPDGKCVLKSGELLNTELRIFALIRIGISDSAKIARFLRCSITTVYTYRSKVRHRAINPDRFEDDVMLIS